jgi:hypothetical protein
MSLLFKNKSYKEINLNTLPGFNQLNLIDIYINKDIINFSIMLPDCNAINVFYNESKKNELVKNLEFRYIYDEVIEKNSSVIFNKIEINKENPINHINEELKNLLKEIRDKKILQNNQFGIRIKFFGKSENYLSSIDEIIKDI